MSKVKIVGKKNVNAKSHRSKNKRTMKKRRSKDSDSEEDEEFSLSEESKSLKHKGATDDEDDPNIGDSDPSSDYKSGAKKKGISKNARTNGKSKREEKEASKRSTIELRNDKKSAN